MVTGTGANFLNPSLFYVLKDTRYGSMDREWNSNLFLNIFVVELQRCVVLLQCNF